MRIAILNWSQRLAGGVEAYLEALAPLLVTAGHEVSFFSELTAPRDRQPLRWPLGAPSWCAEEIGLQPAIQALRQWRPDILYSHAVRDENTEQRLLDIAPTVLFAHQYHGTCISGTKTWSFPAPRVCVRPLGPACLLHYYPHRCGGLSPATMAGDYRKQRKREELLSKYRLIVTHSEHMRNEILRQGVNGGRVRKIPFLLRAAGQMPESTTPPDAWQLVFVGRMERLKGGSVLLSTLPIARARLDHPIALTMVGDGREGESWKGQAAHIVRENPQVSVRFTGWMSPSAVDAQVAAAHLLVMPSLWPEPFGQAGPEAGRFGVPAAGFAVGGIPEWLEDGVSGFLAGASPPTAESLAEAIVRCLREPATYAALRQGAKKVAHRHRAEAHVPALLEALESARRA